MHQALVDPDLKEGGIEIAEDIFAVIDHEVDGIGKATFAIVEAISSNTEAHLAGEDLFYSLFEGAKKCDDLLRIDNHSWRG